MSAVRASLSVLVIFLGLMLIAPEAIVMWPSLYIIGVEIGGIGARWTANLLLSSAVVGAVLIGAGCWVLARTKRAKISN